MRSTLGQLKADFTEFHMTTTGDLEQLRDKTVKQDHLMKLQKQSSDDILNDFSSQITTLQKLVSQQSNIIKKLQDENQILHKKHHILTKQIRPCKNHKIIWWQKLISLKNKWQRFGKTRRKLTSPALRHNLSLLAPKTPLTANPKKPTVTHQLKSLQ